MARKAMANGQNLGNVPQSVLEAELRRRERRVQSLVQRHAKLVASAAHLEDQIRAIAGPDAVANGVTSRRGRPAGATGPRRRGAKPGVRRPRNEQNLVEALASLLKGRTMNVTTAADEVQKAGYKTNSPNFRTIVNQTLLKKKHFKRVGRGQYTAR